MSATITTIFQEIASRLAAATYLQDLPLWFGPPRLNDEVAQADFFLQVDQDGSTFDTVYEFEVRLVTRHAYLSNSIASLDAPAPMGGPDNYAERLVAVFDGVAGPTGWESQMLEAGYERIQDQTTFLLRVRFVDTDSLGVLGPCYGGMYADDAAIAVVVSSLGNYFQVASGLSAGLLENFLFQNSRELVCQLAGDYLINWSISLKVSTAGHDIAGSVMVNGTEQHDGENVTSAASSGRNYSVGGSVLVHLVADDLISLCVTDETGTSTVTVTHANLTIAQVG